MPVLEALLIQDVGSFGRLVLLCFAKRRMKPTLDFTLDPLTKLRRPHFLIPVTFTQLVAETCFRLQYSNNNGARHNMRCRTIANS